MIQVKHPQDFWSGALFAVVGAQMGWILRPFIGAPSEPFQLFRARHASFFAAVWDAFLMLFR
mgnify:CR=1 FL=1